MTWTPQWEFDFSVRASQHVVSATPGTTIAVPMMIELVNGKPQPVILTHTNWDSVGLIAKIIPSSTVLAGTMATLQIIVSPNTPPGSYMFSVRGETSGTFKTSQDTVTIVVQSLVGRQPPTLPPSTPPPTPPPTPPTPAPAPPPIPTPEPEPKRPEPKKPLPKMPKPKPAPPKPKPRLGRKGPPTRRRPPPHRGRGRRYIGAMLGAITIAAVGYLLYTVASNAEPFQTNNIGESGEHWTGTGTYCFMGQDVGFGVVTADVCQSLDNIPLIKYNNGSVQTEGGGGVFGLNGQVDANRQFTGWYNTTDTHDNFNVVGTFYSNGTADLYKIRVMLTGEGGVNITFHLYRQ